MQTQQISNLPFAHTNYVLQDGIPFKKNTLAGFVIFCYPPAWFKADESVLFS